VPNALEPTRLDPFSNFFSGQQISWKAARSITHKFIRLYHPEIAEDVTDEYVHVI